MSQTDFFIIIFFLLFFNHLEGITDGTESPMIKLSQENLWPTHFALLCSIASLANALALTVLQGNVIL